MSTIYQLKPASQNLLRPIVPWLAQIGVTPNQVKIFTTCLAIGRGGLVLWNNCFLIKVPPLMLVGLLFVPEAEVSLKRVLTNDK
jgi:hypothetical protein